MFSVPSPSVWACLDGRWVLTRTFPRCPVTLNAPAPLTTASASLTTAHVCLTLVPDCLATALLNRPVTLKTVVWTLLTEAGGPFAEDMSTGLPLYVTLSYVSVAYTGVC